MLIWNLPRVLVLFIAALLFVQWPSPAPAQNSFAAVSSAIQPKLAKIYGAGGLKGLEAYQSGLLISAEGHILTVWSYVLDADVVTVILDDGRKFTAELVGMDPRLEIAILKINAQELKHFDLKQSAELSGGDRVLAFSNLYGVATGNEASSVLHGQVTAVTDLAARRGAYASPYQGRVYVVDAMTNNPGASGGALTDRRGRLAGLLGKEMRSSQNNIWLNYAIPIPELAPAVDDILAGRTRSAPRADLAKNPKEAHSLATLGIVLVPDFLPKTPPFVELVRPGSAAANVGLKTDDLVLFVNGRLVSSCSMLAEELTFADRLDDLRLTVQRGQELLEFELKAR